MRDRLNEQVNRFKQIMSIISENTNDSIDFIALTGQVIDQLEGGYYHPDMRYRLKGDWSKYGASGETMFGIDRVRGGTPNTSTAGRKFWKIMDDNNARTKWPWNYIPKDPTKSELLKLVAEMMEPQYKQYAKTYLKNASVRTLIESDGRLYYNMIYATWNGPGWFGGFAKLLTNAYNAGSKTSDQLLTVITKERISGGYNAYNLGTGKKLGPNGASLISQTGYKIAKATGVNV